MRDKTNNKTARASVRLTNHQQFMLGQICSECKVKPSTLIRFAIDNLITQYEQQQNEKLGSIQDKTSNNRESEI